MRAFLLAWLLLAAGLRGETKGPEWYREGDAEMLLYRSEESIFLTLTVRAGTKPPEVRAEGVELRIKDHLAANAEWQISENRQSLSLLHAGDPPQAFQPETAEARLAAAKARAEAADAELNRVYGEVKGRRPAPDGQSRSSGAGS